jgi:hypothetical protein
LRDPTDPTKVLSRIPKSQMPTAGQVVETANGPMLINTRTGAAQPIMGAGGQPLAPKLSAEQSKDITAINQYDLLPEKMKNYVAYLNQFLKVPVKYISNGPGRDQIVSV